MPKTKVYAVRTTIPDGIEVGQRPHIRQCTAVVTATSQAHAAERLGVTLHTLRTYGGEVRTPYLVEAAMARPATVAYFPSDSRPTDTPVYGDTQLGYAPPVTVGTSWHAAMVPARHRPYTVVLGWEDEPMRWQVCAVLEGHHTPVPDVTTSGMCVEVLVPEGASVATAAWEAAEAQGDP